MNVANLKITKNLSLSSKIALFIISTLFIIFSIAAFYLYKWQKDITLKESNNRVTGHIEYIKTNIETQLKEKQEQVNIALNLAHNMFYANNLTLSESSTEKVQAVNQITKNVETVEIPTMYLNDQKLISNYSLVDKIKEKSVETATIFQKIPQGYLRISTNVLKNDGTRAVGTYIPNSSEVIKTVNNKNTFKGRAFVVNDWYLTAYEPIIVNSKVEGILYVGVKENNYTILKQLFNETKLYDSGVEFLVGNKGEMKIHPKLEKQNVKDEDYFQKLISIGTQEGMFTFLDDKNVRKQLFYTFIPDIESYVCFMVNEKDSLSILSKLKQFILFILLISSLLIALSVLFIVKRLTLPLQKLSDQIKLLSLGKHANSIEYSSNDEIGSIAQSTDKLIEGLQKTASFAEDIGAGNLEADFSPLSDDDVLGNSLLKMRTDLKRSFEEEQKRKIEDELRDWTTQGLARFGELLIENNDDLEVFSYSVVSNLVKYLNANQGGLFIVNEENERKLIEQKATYAYDRKKFENKLIEYGEGLIGQCILEKKTIVLTDFPENYISITSGLGNANPTSIIIVPLKLNDIVYGAVEIASFNSFEKHQISFVEKIAENVASTISTVNINLKTVKLLKQTQQQKEQMQSQEEELRQNLEEMQATQEEKSRALLLAQQSVDNINNIPTPILTIDKAYNITYINLAGAKVAGIKVEEAKTKKCHELFINADCNTDKCRLHRAMKDGQIHSGDTVVDPEGKAIPVSYTGSPIKNEKGEITGALEFIIENSN